VDLSKERLLTLLELLQVHREMGGEEIAQRLEVTPRTVRRYISGDGRAATGCGRASSCHP